MTVDTTTATRGAALSPDQLVTSPLVMMPMLCCGRMLCAC
ncbi:Protein of unknown function [Propionibacterium freudenreichii subsp. freudenreichii]|uniref:Uncharacterized protein n=2 Tax=Propionibacterium freudenreichii TaxID=1744 RepID=A0A2C8BE17_9ACTN|nr:Protein of unknown function [Propionibacterium freudenreichii subsp. freudenreichii]CEG86953.1 Protein of unknown function [Propionibacterium freudenreichii]CUW07455.1 conserved protein [Propionibacterium freudenreichii subsp. shermanii]CEG96813.1 Protein of unknown function [Propionibacterium freudenreichii]CEG98026.1 Protein of unknown function [Propionibacterium freudenreichii]